MSNETASPPIEDVPKTRKTRTKKVGPRRPQHANGGPEPVTQWTVADDRKITLLVEYNPKTPKSPTARRFELYKKAGDVGTYRKWMRQGKAGGKPHFANLDLARDRDRGYIKF